MARQKRVWYPGATYHVMSRGNRRSAIFQDRGDYLHFLEVTRIIKEKYPFKIHSLCLMTNHFHTERYIPETGYTEETSLHFEIMDGRIVKEIKNDGVFYEGNLVSNPLCVNCHHIDIKSDVREPQKHDMEWLNKLLKEYRGIDDDEELDED